MSVVSTHPSVCVHVCPSFVCAFVPPSVCWHFFVSVYVSVRPSIYMYLSVLLHVGYFWQVNYF